MGDWGDLRSGLGVHGPPKRGVSLEECSKIERKREKIEKRGDAEREIQEKTKKILIKIKIRKRERKGEKQLETKVTKVSSTASQRNIKNPPTLGRVC